MKNVFLSFNLENYKDFVSCVYLYLKRQPDLNVFFYDKIRHGADYNTKINNAVEQASYFVFFHGAITGDYQVGEANRWYEHHGKDINCRRMIIKLPDPGKWDQAIIPSFDQGVDPIRVNLSTGEQTLTERHAYKCAQEIAITINGSWIPYDGLPQKYIFDYEKDIIEQFAPPRNKPDGEHLKKGCPNIWPKVILKNGKRFKTPPLLQKKIGSFRKPTATVLVDVRSNHHKSLTFLEAGPREFLLHGEERQLNVGILVAGGIAPGINAVIAGIVERHSLYWKELVKKGEQNRVCRIHCYLDGFCGLLKRRKHIIRFHRIGDENPQNNRRLATILANANAGGAVLGTSRYDELSDLKNLNRRKDAMDNVLEVLWNDRIEILYIIGGDGSMKAAHALNTINDAWLKGDPDKNNRARTISFIGIPKTMDNDILWVWQSFGFISAVEKASEYLRLLHTEATSNPRLCIIQLFGSDSGFTVSHAALASLQCDAALIPEMDFNMDWLFEHIRNRLQPRLGDREEQLSPYGMIVMAETSVPTDWYRYVNWKEHLERMIETPEEFIARIKDKELKNHLEEQMENAEQPEFLIDLSRQEVEAIITFVENERRVYGQTPDTLRTVSLRLVSQVLQHKIQSEMEEDNTYWKTFRVFTSEPRHLLRSSPPSANDIISGRRFGTLAVDNAMAGYSDFMISQWLTEYVLVPLSLVVLGRKRVYSPGIFWKSVLAKTEQKDMVKDQDDPAQ